jgi:Glycosyltransferases involved in cell wall biogenesis
MGMVEISVIIPLLNKGPYVKRAIDSVLQQEYHDFEIIIVEGGSIDSGPEIIKSIQDPRIRLIRQPTKGVAEARNFGVEVSVGSAVAFLDADDEWFPGHLTTIKKLMRCFPEAGAYTTAYKICDNTGKMRAPKYRAIPLPPWEGILPNYFLSAVRGEFPVWTSVVCIPKKIYIEMGGFPQGAWWGEDADLWGKIALRYPIAFSWETGAIYHWDAQGRVCSRPSLDEEPFVKSGRQAIAEHRVPDAMVPDVLEYINKKELYRVACNLFVNDRRVARDILWATKTRYFFIPKFFLYSLSFMPDPLVKKILRYFFFK